MTTNNAAKPGGISYSAALNALSRYETRDGSYPLRSGADPEAAFDHMGQAIGLLIMLEEAFNDADQLMKLQQGTTGESGIDMIPYGRVAAAMAGISTLIGLAAIETHAACYPHEGGEA